MKMGRSQPYRSLWNDMYLKCHVRITVMRFITLFHRCPKLTVNGASHTVANFDCKALSKQYKIFHNSHKPHLTH